MNIKFGTQISVYTLRYALFIMTICYLPHVFSTPWWLSLLALTSVMYRVLGSYRNLSIPSFQLRLIISVIVLWALGIYYQSYFSNEYFIGVLVTFYWLKLLELQTSRDIIAIVIISFYIIFSTLIINPELWVFIYVVIAYACTLILLLKVYVPSLTLKKIINQVVRYFLIVLPLGLLMFVVFPRLSAPLWMVSLPSKAGTGFREDLTPGNISDLQKDPTTVMRVHFNLDQAQQFDLYFKGLTLSKFDGKTWSNPYINSYIYEQLPVLSKYEPGDYEILLEAHHHKWLFYLEMPHSADPILKYNNRTGLVRRDLRRIDQRFVYQIKSSKSLYEPLKKTFKRQYLNIPSTSNPKLQKLAKKMMFEASNDPQKLTESIERIINTGNYWYKLNPSTEKNINQLDYFWFDSKEGYCEHYASAMAFIYRAAGVPSRVIIGYVGGEWNPIGQYLNIRRMDAHAWVEYWLEGKGWQRVDPTRFIAPARIEKDINDNQPTSFDFQHLWKNYPINLSLYNRFKVSIEYYKYFAERWFLFYNQDKQKKFFSHMGFPNINKTQLLQMWITFILAYIAIGFLISKYRLPKKTPINKEYQKLKMLFSHLGIHTKTPGTINTQVAQLINKYPRLKHVGTTFINSYEKLRLKNNFSEKQEKNNDKKLILLIKAFRKDIKKLISKR